MIAQGNEPGDNGQAMPAPRARARAAAVALLCALAVAIAACSYGGDGDEESASTTEGRTRETTQETVLGAVFERDVAPAVPAEPVAVPMTAPSTTTTTTARPRPTTTTVAPTTIPAPRPNRIAGQYAAHPNATSVTVDLYREGVLAASRELGGSGTFDFAELPPGTYRVVVTDRQDEGNTSSEVISACPDVGLTDGDGAFVDAAFDRDCTVALSSP